MKVSIIVPVYNTEKYLKSCLDSLINQTLQDIEIITIDDCSTDHSIEILKEYKKKYPSKIKIITQDKNLGQSATRNNGIKEAKGEYIGFLDSDDYVNFHMYQTMYEAAYKNNYPEIITTGLIFIKDDYYLKTNFKDLKREKGRIIEVLKNPNNILDESPSVCNKIFRADILKKHLFLEGRMWEDVAFSYAKMFCANKILSFSNPDYFYRRRETEGVSHNGYNINSHLLDIFDIADQIEIEVKAKGRFEQLEKQIRFLQISTCLQRVTEIFSWKISNKELEELCYLMSTLIIKKYGDFRKINEAELSSRVGFFELKKIKTILAKKDNLEQNDLQEKTKNKLNKIKKANK